MQKMMCLAAAILLGAGVACAALTEADLTPEKVVAAMKAQPANARRAYARQVLEAVAARPADDAAKVQALTTASRALLSGGGSIGVIADIFNTVPVEHLQGVADLLAKENFDQKVNGMTDEQFDAFCKKVVSVASREIEASGSDSPAVRMSILAATFTKASSNPDRTRPQMVAALPAAVQAAAATYITASESGNREVIAAAAGVDEVAETPADPDAKRVVKAEQKKTDAVSQETVSAAEEPKAADKPKAEAAYLEPKPPANAKGEPSAEAEVDVKVPLLSRFADDVLGITIDTMEASMYDWESPGLLPPTVAPTGALDVEAGVDSTTPEGTPRPLPVKPSPTYGNQYL